MSEDENETSQTSLETNSMRAKIPDFFQENVELWFWQTEAVFKANRISSDETKYYTVIGSLPPNVIFKISDLQQNPPTAHLYKTLKDRIIKEFADSQMTKVTQLLTNIHLGDKKPSELLAEMRAKSLNTSITEELLTQLWIRNLPETVRAILSANESATLSIKADIADKITESMATKNINSVEINATSSNQKSINLNDLGDLIKTLRDEIKLNRRSRSSTRSSRSTSRYRFDRNQSPTHNDNYCWYHNRWRDNATKCKQPCSFKTHPKN